MNYAMKHEEFVKLICSLVEEYIDNFDMFDSNPQIRVNPVSLDAALVNGSDMLSELEDSNEAVEDAAGARGAETEDASDYQVKQNPDFYPVKELLRVSDVEKTGPDAAKIESLAAKYV